MLTLLVIFIKKLQVTNFKKVQRDFATLAWNRCPGDPKLFDGVTTLLSYSLLEPAIARRAV